MLKKIRELMTPEDNNFCNGTSGSMADFMHNVKAGRENEKKIVAKKLEVIEKLIREIRVQMGI